MMKASIEQISPVKKRLTVEVEAEEVDRKIEEAYKELKKRANVDGFRPGKVPRNILQRHFGDQVTQDVKRGLLSETLPQAFEETKIFPVAMPVIEHETLKAGEGYKYVALKLHGASILKVELIILIARQPAACAGGCARSWIHISPTAVLDNTPALC